MATQQSTQSTRDASVKHFANQVLRSFDRDDATRIDARLAQLTALLTSFHGEGSNGFSELNDHLQDNLLWLASDLAQEVEKAWLNSKAVQP